MPAYNASPFGAPAKLLLPGATGYSWGSFSDDTPSTVMYVSRSAINGSNVATLTVQVWQGPVPIAGQLVSTQGLTNIPNVTNVAIASATINSSGAGTITYALTHATVAAAADAGLAIAPQLEVGETIPATLTNSGGAGAAFAIGGLQFGNARSIAWSVSFPGGGPSSSFEADLEGAIANSGSQFFKLDKITSTSGGTQTYTPVSQLNFVRVTVTTADNAGSGKIVAKISI